MATLLGRRHHGPPPACFDMADPHMTIPVIIPWGCRAGCCEDCGCEGIPPDHMRTHARDTIRVPPGSAQTIIKLDDGTGEGYCFAMPMLCMELRFRFKGERCTCFTIRSLSAEFGSELVIHWPRDWERARPGYYEAEIVMNPGTPTERKGGWLLFHKMPPRQMRAARAHSVAPLPPLDGYVPECAPLPNFIGEPVPDVADCGDEGCDECP